jgi:hypothetical protein
MGHTKISTYLGVRRFYQIQAKVEATFVLPASNRAERQSDRASRARSSEMDLQLRNARKQLESSARNVQRLDG